MHFLICMTFGHIFTNLRSHWNSEFDFPRFYNWISVCPCRFLLQQLATVHLSLSLRILIIFNSLNSKNAGKPVLGTSFNADSNI
jgi:hypothetical protein